MNFLFPDDSKNQKEATTTEDNEDSKDDSNKKANEDNEDGAVVNQQDDENKKNEDAVVAASSSAAAAADHHHHHHHDNPNEDHASASIVNVVDDVNVVNDEGDDDVDTVEEDDVVVVDEALDDLLLRQRDERIRELEEIKANQDEELKELRCRLGQDDVMNQHEVFWMRLELDHVRRQKEDVEDRADLLYLEWQYLQEPRGPSSNYLTMEYEEVQALQQEATKYFAGRSQAVKSSDDTLLENDKIANCLHELQQLETSGKGRIQSIQDEIRNRIEEKNEMEVDLVQQLTSLDHELRLMQWEHQIKLLEKDCAIQRELNPTGTPDALTTIVEEEDGMTTTETATTMTITTTSAANQTLSTTEDSSHGDAPAPLDHNATLKEYEEEIVSLKKRHEELEEALGLLEEETRARVEPLEQDHARLEKDLVRMEEEWEEMRGAAEEKAVKLVDRINQDRVVLYDSLDKVSHVWEKAHDSVRLLETAMDRLRPYSSSASKKKKINMNQTVNHQRLASTLETAFLVHTEIKTCVLLLEGQLRKQIWALKNNDEPMLFLSEQEQELTLLKSDLEGKVVQKTERVEASFVEKLQPLQERTAQDEEKKRKLSEQLGEAQEEIQKMKHLTRQLEATVKHLRWSEKIAKLRVKKSKRKAKRKKSKRNEDDTDDDMDEDDTEQHYLSRPCWERLYKEATRVSERLKHKNRAIEFLEVVLRRQKAKVSNLKKQREVALKRYLASRKRHRSSSSTTSTTSTTSSHHHHHRHRSSSATTIRRSGHGPAAY